mgnify:CR=1 FL=1
MKFNSNSRKTRTRVRGWRTPPSTPERAERLQMRGRRDGVKPWSGPSPSMPQVVGLTFGVHNGQKHVPVLVSEDMVGMKLGEFAPTRFFPGHAADKKAKRK